MAFSNQYVLKVDIKRRMSSIVPTFKQGDNGVLKFQVFDDGKKYDLTDYTYSEITFRLPSGQSIVGNPILGLDGILTYNFTGVEMSEVGKIETVLSIYSGSQMVSIQPFTCFIYDSMKGEDLSYIGILQDLIAEVQLLNTEVSEVVNGLGSTLEEANRIKNELDGFNTSIKVDEQKRESNEAQRMLNESTRATDENSRKSNEVTRGNNEAQRTLNENERKSNESTRQSNESTRQANEISRSNNEEQRQLKFAQIEVTINQLKAAENFSLATQYKKHNIVTYNGSSFIARKDTIGNLPPILPITFNEFWQLVAQRGVDGEGSVKSVNNISPDVNGNVALEIITSWDGIAGKPQTFPPTIHQHTMSDITGLQSTLDSKYVKPASGIPSTDMTSAVQTSLGKADTAIQTLPSASTTVKGIVQLNNTTNSTSTVLAPTANALKIVNDSLTTTTNNLITHAVKIASIDELGHIKVGENLTILPDGTLNASGGTVPDASTTQKGIVQLIESISSTSKTHAPTASALTSAYNTLDLLKANKTQEDIISLSGGEYSWNVNNTKYFKDEFGIVHVYFHAIAGNKLGNLTLATMPVGYRPKFTIYGAVVGIEGGSSTVTHSNYISVEATGAMRAVASVPSTIDNYRGYLSWRTT